MQGASEPQLALLAAHQRSVGIDRRERLLESAVRAPRSEHLVVLATCHRFEAYAAIPAGAAPRAWFAERFGLAAEDDALAAAAVMSGSDVALHLFRVACGLDSTVRGEAQILGQVRATYAAARAAGPLVHALSELFQTALHVARELRAQTALGTVTRSLGSIAVDEVVRLLDAPRAATALVVGAGEIGKLSARALAQRVGRVLIANRDAARGAALAQRIGGYAVPLDAVASAIARADVLISAADTRGAVLTRELIAQRVADRPLLLVDMAVPRSVAEDARALPGLTYRSVDDLVPPASPELAGAIAAAEARCVTEADALLRRQGERQASATIRAMRDHGERIRRRHLDQALARLGHVSERDRRVVEALSAALTSSLLHAPTVALRGSPQHEHAARELFGIAEQSVGIAEHGE